MNIEYINSILVVAAIKKALHNMGIKKLHPEFIEGKIEIDGISIGMPEVGTPEEKARDILVDYFARKITSTISGLPNEAKGDTPFYNGTTEYRKEEILALINQYRAQTVSTPKSKEAIHQDEIQSRRFFSDICQIGGFRAFKYNSEVLFKRESEVIIVYGETQSLIWSFRLGLMGFFHFIHDCIWRKKTTFNMMFNKREYVNDKAELDLLFEKNIQEDKTIYLDSIRRGNQSANPKTPQPYSTGSEPVILPFNWYRTPFRF